MKRLKKRWIVSAACLTCVIASANASLATAVVACVNKAVATAYKSGSSANYAVYLTWISGAPSWTGQQYYYLTSDPPLPAGGAYATALTALPNKLRVEANIQSATNAQGSLIDVITVTDQACP